MSSRSMALYLHGAIIKDEDFDSCKLILQEAEFLQEEVSAELKAKMLNGESLASEELNELCEAVYVDSDDIESVEDISHALLEDKHELFSQPNEGPLSGDAFFSVEFISGLEEMEFRYDNGALEPERLENCLLFVMPTQSVWAMDRYEGPVGENAVIERLRQLSAGVLKEDIPWADRLGELIGTEVG